VVADIAKLSVGREAYYTRELATDHEQYLSGHGESPGRWYGAGAISLGLQGEASSAGFRRMFEGRHPDTGELLGRAHGEGAVPAFDVVLRPTRASRSSTASGMRRPAEPSWPPTTLAYARPPPTWMSTRGTRRGHEHVQGRGLLAVGFDHRTSREDDPLLRQDPRLADIEPGVSLAALNLKLANSGRYVMVSRVEGEPRCTVSFVDPPLEFHDTRTVDEAQVVSTISDYIDRLRNGRAS
jgi:hypothetical protein